MNLLETIWTSRVNIHILKCDCGQDFESPANYSVTVCPNCGKAGLLYKNEDMDGKVEIVKEVWLNK